MLVEHLDVVLLAVDFDRLEFRTNADAGVPVDALLELDRLPVESFEQFDSRDEIVVHDSDQLAFLVTDCEQFEAALLLDVSGGRQCLQFLQVVAKIIYVRVYFHVQIQLLVFEVCDFELGLLLDVVLHLYGLNYAQLALGTGLLDLLLVAGLHDHLDALRNVDLHRVDRNLEPELVLQLLDLFKC